MTICTCDMGAGPHQHYRQVDTYGAAPAPSPAEQAVIDRFEAAVEPEEIRVERVARALWDADGWNPNYWTSTRAVHSGEQQRCRYRAEVAIAALEPPR